MSQSLFDRYKEALRRGHVAALQGQLDVAVSAFEAAAALAPDRALPCVGLGDVLRRLGRHEAAIEAFGEALRRAPGDEGAIRGRAAVRVLQRRPIDAANDLEHLAELLERSDRVPEACEAACDALDLAESRSRRKTVERLARRLESQAGSDAVAHALARARAHLEVLAPPPQPADVGSAVTPTDHPVDEVAPDGSTVGQERSVAGRPFDRVAARLEAEEHLAAGRSTHAVPLLLAVAAAEREAGELDAALDACLSLMAIDPADPATQLELAANQVARGWTTLATDKVRLLERLAGFSADRGAAATIAAFASDHGLEVGPTA